MLYKGGIFKAWEKKQCVVIQKSFFETLPALPTTTKDKADIAWFLYDLKLDKTDNQYHLVLADTIYTEFQSPQNIYTNHVQTSCCIQGKLDERITNHPKPLFFELL